MMAYPAILDKSRGTPIKVRSILSVDPMRRSRSCPYRGTTSKPSIHPPMHWYTRQVYRRGQPLLNGTEYRSGEELTVKVEGRSGAFCVCAPRCVCVHACMYIHACK